ncbi:MAG: SAM-dependent methyltransferase [Hyphomicrobiales bacterium]|nr:SAM-dependent methyltransferase [Hyphomicrobiales bacterium]
MTNAQQNEFLEACRLALTDGSFLQAVFGLDSKDKSKGKDKARARFERIAGGRKTLVHYTNSRTDTDQQSELIPDLVYMTMRSGDITPFRSATLFTEGFDLHYAENRKREARVYKSKASMKGQVREHNKPKNYVLGRDRPYLRELGVTNRAGEVLAKHYGKFRQIANFVEIIDRTVGDFVAAAEAPVSILDLGCGKGYLTFATYDYIRSRAKVEPQALGVDIKTNVIDLCNRIAKELDFTGLTFRNARIEPDRSEALDILIALHACDTATDDALALGVRSGMKFLFCAPCCQAEIAAQTGQPDKAFGLINQFPLMKRRQADIVTDVCRALLLNAAGYETTFLEFTALEHTSKNVMLTGRLSGSVDRKKAYADYLTLKAGYGFTRHALEENLRDRLE